jgi:hypothetical protein
MRSLTIALGSFALGVSFTLLLLPGYRTPIVFAQQPTQYNGNPFTPKVPPPPRMLSEENTQESVLIEVDGLTSRKDTYVNPTFGYGGGAFYLKDATVKGHLSFQFVGAAANTVTFLRIFGLFGCQAPANRPEPVNPNRPITESATLKMPVSGDIVSPYQK